MPVVEVMNYDKPVIASNLSIFQELIGDEINYFTISDDNKESAKRLAKRMSDYEQPTEGSYEKIIERYVPQNLSFVEDAQLRTKLSGSAPDCGDAQVDIYLADENTVNKAYRISGEEFNPSDKDSVCLLTVLY